MQDTLFTLEIDPYAVDFFYDHAGAGYHPDHETFEEGRLRGAKALAEAETYAKAHGWSAQWFEDPDAQYDDRNTEWADYPHYFCQVGSMDAGPFDAMDVLGSLGSVMFAEGKDEYDDPYARVVVAELFLEAMREHQKLVAA